MFKGWTLFFGYIVFVLAGLLAIATYYEMTPVDVQVGQCSKNIYWISLIHSSLSIFIFGLSTIISIILLFRFARLGKSKRKPIFLSLSLFTFSLILSAYTILSSILMQFEPIASLKVVDSVYHLGVRGAIDSDYLWVIDKCDSWNIFCKRCGIEYVSNNEYSDIKKARLEYSQNSDALFIKASREKILVKNFR